MSTVLSARRRIRPTGRVETPRHTIRALVATIRAFDAYTGGHSDRVAHYARAIAAELDLDRWSVETVHRAGYVHDIGKICLPESVLLKPGPLDEEEMALVRLHPAMGARILEGRGGLDPLVPAVLHHHERWDGSGYPDGLAGTDIPLEARIVFLADAYDAMTSDRPYDRQMSVVEAVQEIIRCSGSDFDPTLVKALNAAQEKGELEYTSASPPLLVV